MEQLFVRGQAPALSILPEENITVQLGSSYADDAVSAFAAVVV